MSRTSLPRLAKPAATAPKAQRDQPDVQSWERGLLDLARVKYPAVVWWHGYRKIDGVMGSYCYICNGFICTFSTAYPLPQSAVDAIAKHKAQHHAGKRPTLARIKTGE